VTLSGPLRHDYYFLEVQPCSVVGECHTFGEACCFRFGVFLKYVKY
jgi:hypothetical protein